MEKLPSFVHFSKLTAALLACAVSACGGGSGGDGEGSGQGLSEAAAKSFEGVYETTAYTENSTGCEGAGEDRLATTSEPHFLLVTTVFFGQRVLEMMSCVDVADCQDRAAKYLASDFVAYQYGASFTEQAGPDELGGFTAWTGFEENGICTMREYDEFTLVRDGENVTVDGVTKSLADKPVEDGFCVAEPAKDRQEAEDAPCASSLGIAGTRVADL
jgi:hypothetical protein